MPVSPLVVASEMFGGPHLASQHAQHEKLEFGCSFREHVGGVREGDTVTVSIGTVDVVKANRNLCHDLEVSFARLEYFSVNLVPQGCDQTVNAGFHFLDNQTFGWSLGIGIDLDVISPLAQQIDGFPNITGGKNTVFRSHVFSGGAPVGSLADALTRPSRTNSAAHHITLRIDSVAIRQVGEQDHTIPLQVLLRPLINPPQRLVQILQRIRYAEAQVAFSIVAKRGS